MIIAQHTFINAYFQADPFGKGIFLALFLLSLISWFFILHKIWIFREVKKYSSLFQTLVDKHRESLLNLSGDHLPKIVHRDIPHPYAHIYLTLKNKTVEILSKNNRHADAVNYLSHNDVELINSHLHSTIIRQKENLEKNLFILSTTITLAPFLGLLGTVWGILITFSELQNGGSASSNTVILGGLSTALTTTVLGLLVAIPSLIAYSYLKNFSRRYTSEMVDFSHAILSTIEMQYRKVDVK
ncbi:MAG: MotA/TolQ/ExbB proton channel family protein [Simkaniaceae bacterium]|nr:MotA/TolQ/ExbB proton channel family protein [Simkaniaceae bacterium]